MSVPISKSTTSSTSHDQARIATASDNINNDVADASLNEGCQFNNRNVCKVCNKLFSHNGNLKTHMRTHTGSYSCKKCYEVCTGMEDLKKHMQTHKRKKFFKCTVCNKCFPYVRSLNRHVELVHQVAEVSKINLSNCNNIRTYALTKPL